MAIIDGVTRSFWRSHPSQPCGFRRTPGTVGVSPTLVFLALLGGALGCRPDARSDWGSSPGGSAVAATDSDDVTHQVAEMDRIGPTAQTDRAALAQLGHAIRDPRPEVASRAAHWLVQAGPAALPMLRAALADSSPRVRISASYVLGLLGPEASAVVPALTRQLAGENDSVANMAGWALSEIEPGGSGTLVRDISALRYGTTLERADAASRLGLQGEASIDAILILVRALADSDWQVARAASDALVRIGYRSIPAVEAALLSVDRNLRARAALVLSRIGPVSRF